MKKTSVQSNINLETLAGGAFAEKLNEGLPEGLRVLGRILPVLVVLLSAVQMFRSLRR